MPSCCSLSVRAAPHRLFPSGTPLHSHRRAEIWPPPPPRGCEVILFAVRFRVTIALHAARSSVQRRSSLETLVLVARFITMEGNLGGSGHNGFLYTVYRGDTWKKSLSHCISSNCKSPLCLDSPRNGILIYSLLYFKLLPVVNKRKDPRSQPSTLVRGPTIVVCTPPIEICIRGGRAGGQPADECAFGRL